MPETIISSPISEQDNSIPGPQDNISVPYVQSDVMENPFLI